MSINYQYNQWLLECINIVNQNFEKQRKAELIAIALIIKMKNIKKKKKKFWMAEILKRRSTYGFYHAILPSVRLDLGFQNYTRMTTTQFEELLSIVGADLQKQYVVREPINEEQRLILTIRYI